jgi:ubiquinone/menaquinone biosynthesis C-methylase UbiE
MAEPELAKDVVKQQYDAAGSSWHKIRGSGHELLEKPAIYNLLPSVEGKRVLCVGSGYGEECARILALGAKKVVGIDLSESNVQQARQQYPSLEFHQMDMEQMSFGPASFDVVFSSLALHYVQNWNTTLTGMRRVLAPDGSIVISTHHPASWSALKEENEITKRQLLGFEVDKASGNISLFGDYLHERPVISKFGGTFEASFYHKNFSGMLREFRDAGLCVVDCQEPGPIAEAQALDPQFWELRSRFPLFILFKLERALGIVD